MLLHQIIEKKKFYIDGSIAFDFSNEYPITHVEFFNFSNGKNLEHRASSISKNYQVNSVIITGTDAAENNNFRYNLDGIKGLIEWNDPLYIGVFMCELLKKHNSRYNIYQGDCSASYTALIASKMSSVHSMILSSPVINAGVISKDEVDGKIQGLSYRKNVEDTINIDRQILDALPILIDNVNKGVKTTINWAKDAYGSDLYEKDRVMKLPKYESLEIKEHYIPPTHDSHFISTWLHNTGQLSNMLQTEIKIANAILSLNR